VIVFSTLFSIPRDMFLRHQYNPGLVQYLHGFCIHIREMQPYTIGWCADNKTCSRLGLSCTVRIHTIWCNYKSDNTQILCFCPLEKKQLQDDGWWLWSAVTVPDQLPYSVVWSIKNQVSSRKRNSDRLSLLHKHPYFVWHIMGRSRHIMSVRMTMYQFVISSYSIILYN